MKKEPLNKGPRHTSIKGQHIRTVPGLNDKHKVEVSDNGKETE